MYTILCIVTSFHFTSGGILQGARISWCVTLALYDSKASAMQMFLMSSIEEKERLLQPAPVLQPTSWNCGRGRLPGLLCWQRVSCLWSYADERFRIIRIAHQIPVTSVWNPYVQRTQKAATFWICTKALPSNCEPLAAIEAGRKCWSIWNHREMTSSVDIPMLAQKIMS